VAAMRIRDFLNGGDFSLASAESIGWAILGSVARWIFLHCPRGGPCTLTVVVYIAAKELNYLGRFTEPGGGHLYPDWRDFGPQGLLFAAGKNLITNVLREWVERGNSVWLGRPEIFERMRRGGETAEGSHTRRERTTESAEGRGRRSSVAAKW
jgi:hypothetical protein